MHVRSFYLPVKMTPNADNHLIFRYTPKMMPEPSHHFCEEASISLINGGWWCLFMTSWKAEGFLTRTKALKLWFWPLLYIFSVVRTLGKAVLYHQHGDAGSKAGRRRRRRWRHKKYQELVMRRQMLMLLFVLVCWKMWISLWSWFQAISLLESRIHLKSPWFY